MERHKTMIRRKKLTHCEVGEVVTYQGHLHQVVELEPDTIVTYNHGTHELIRFPLTIRGLDRDYAVTQIVFRKDRR